MPVVQLIRFVYGNKVLVTYNCSTAALMQLSRICVDLKGHAFDQRQPQLSRGAAPVTRDSSVWPSLVQQRAEFEGEVGQGQERGATAAAKACTCTHLLYRT